MPKIKVFKVSHKNLWDDEMEKAVIRDLSSWSEISDSDLAWLRAWARQKNAKAVYGAGHIVIVEELDTSPAQIDGYIYDVQEFRRAEEEKEKKRLAEREAAAKAKKKAAEQKKIEEAKKLLEEKGLLPGAKKAAKKKK